MAYDGMTAAEVYDQEVVTGIFGEWTPALVSTAAPVSGERVLDLACGSGGVTRLLASRVAPGGSVVAVDLSPAMLDVARARGVDGVAVEWHQASAEQLPLPDDDVDLITCQQGLQFFPDKASAAAEMARVLRPGGRIALSVWCGLDSNPLQKAFNESLLVHAGAAIFTAPFSFGDPAVLRSLLSDAGLEVSAIEAETKTAAFDSLEHFAEVHVVGAAAVIPAFAEMEAAQRSKLIDSAVQDLEATAGPFLTSEGLRFPMSSLVATAHKPA
ncbi:MAG: class I SAM-dependent methyltransferase [Actinomycetota bacterium]